MTCMNESYHRSEGHVAAVDLGEAKVSQLHLTLTGHQNVLWFQVSVHHMVRVKECKAAQQLPHQILQQTTVTQQNRNSVFY